MLTRSIDKSLVVHITNAITFRTPILVFYARHVIFTRAWVPAKKSLIRDSKTAKFCAIQIDTSRQKVLKLKHRQSCNYNFFLLNFSNSLFNLITIAQRDPIRKYYTSMRQLTREYTHKYIHPISALMDNELIKGVFIQQVSSTN